MTTPAKEAQGRRQESEVGAESDERISAPASLDAAWAEAETALPEGWVIGDLSQASEFVMGQWRAKAVLPRDDAEFGRVYDDLASGPGAESPIAALYALAAKLRER